MALNLKTETVFTDDTPAAQPPLPPEQIAPHFPQLEILECLGRGGMGVVYKARQKTLNRFVALKLLAPERVNDTKFAERFTREAQALAALNHPNIVTIYDFGQAGGFYFLLMEFVDGLNLRQLLRTRKFTPEEALAIVPPLCDALQFAHDRSIVHRDIKPENLLLDKTGRVKVADFGIAKMLGTANGNGNGSEPVSPVNVTQSAVGTPGYSAPEQKTDPQHVDSRADIYSLGVVFYEMLTGELPGKKIVPPSVKVQIDVRLDEIVLRALEKKPELRYQQVSEVKTCVETIVGSAGVPPMGSLPADPGAAVISSSAEPSRYWKWFGVTVLTLGTILVGVVLVGFVIPHFIQERKAVLVQEQRSEAARESGPVIAGDEISAVAALERAIQAADPDRAEEAFEENHQNPPSKKEIEGSVGTIVNAAISVMDQTAEFEKHFPQSKELPGIRDSLVETLSVVFGSMGLPVPPNRAADLETCTRNLMHETPDDFRLYMILCRVAAASPIARQGAIYEELSSESTPRPARDMALAALHKIERLGLPIDLTFTAVDGRQVSLADLKGKVVLLDFWATTCVPCMRDLPDLKQLYTKYNRQGLEIVGISLDRDKEALTRFIEKEKIPWPQYYDPAGETNRVAQTYGIAGIPVVWLVDRHGRLRQLNARQDQDQKVETLLEE